MIWSGSSISVVLAATAGILSSSLRSYLRTMPNVHIVAEVGCSQNLIATLEAYRPQVLVLDADLPSLDLAPSVQHALRVCGELGVVVLANGHDQHAVAIGAGAHHVLLKGFLGQQLRQAVLAGAAPHPSSSEGDCA